MRPGATALALGGLLNRAPDGVLWWLGLGVSAIVLIAVLIAAFLVKALPLVWVRWLVIVVVVYAALGLLRAASRTAPAPAASPGLVADSEPVSRG